jgi:hypothetical protein
VPVARPVASSPRPQHPCSQVPFEPVTTPKDSLLARPSRISSRQLDQIASDLTDSDQLLLRFVAEVRLASGHQLRRRFFEGRDGRAVRRVLLRLVDWRVLERLPRRVGGVRSGSDGFLYVVGVAGARVLARGGQRLRRLEAPGDRYIAHTLAISELLVLLHEANRRGELDLISAETEPTCWRVFTGPAHTRLVLKPDALLRIGAGGYEDRWFVELDLATEARGTLVAKAKRYIAHLRSGQEQAAAGVYPRVLWIAPDARRVEQIQDALKALPPEHRRLFGYCLFEGATTVLAEEARQ